MGRDQLVIGPILQQHAARAAPQPRHCRLAQHQRVHLRIAIGAVLGGRVVASSGVHAVTWVGAIVVSISVGLASINALGTRRARLAGR
jgi:predicted MFS family arabinose efflux permease